MACVDFNRSLLESDTAFYKQNDYLENSSWAKATTKYTWRSTPSKNDHILIKLFKFLLKIIFCIPIALYKGFYLLARILIVQSSGKLHQNKYKKTCEAVNTQFQKTRETDPFKYKRITVEVDGHKIDAALIGSEKTFTNGKWILASNGAQGFYEQKLLHTSDFQQILTESDSNGLVFNYPGAGKSRGIPSRDTLTKVYRAMLSFLEDQETGIGAKQIIGYGHSLGAGVQADALKTPSMKNKIQYVWIKSRTFATISKVAWPIAYLVKLLGWNIDTFNSSKHLRAPEIILQTSENEKIVSDGLITAKASLTQALIKDGSCLMSRKKFISVQEKHTKAWKPETISTITEAINDSLENYPTDSHINMRHFQSYITATPRIDRVKTILEIFNEAKAGEIKADITLFGTRIIRLQGAGHVSLKWLFKEAKEDKTLEQKLQDYFKESSKRLSKRNRVTQTLTKVQDFFNKHLA